MDPIPERGPDILITTPSSSGPGVLADPIPERGPEVLITSKGKKKICETPPTGFHFGLMQGPTTPTKPFDPNVTEPKQGDWAEEQFEAYMKRKGAHFLGKHIMAVTGSPDVGRIGLDYVGWREINGKKENIIAEVKFAKSKSISPNWNPDIETVDGVYTRLPDAVGRATAADLIVEGLWVWRAKVYRDGTIEAKIVRFIPGTGPSAPAPPQPAPPQPKPIQLPLFPDDEGG
jgi:hypothetical protein